MQIIPETQTDSSFPHTPTNDAQQPDISKSNTPAPEKQEKTNTQQIPITPRYPKPR